MSDLTPMYHVRIGGKQSGPLSAEQLKAMAARGTIGRHDRVQRVGGSRWHQADTVKGLFPPEPAPLLASSETGPKSPPIEPPVVPPAVPSQPSTARASVDVKRPRIGFIVGMSILIGFLGLLWYGFYQSGDNVFPEMDRAMPWISAVVLLLAGGTLTFMIRRVRPKPVWVQWLCVGLTSVLLVTAAYYDTHTVRWAIAEDPETRKETRVSGIVYMDDPRYKWPRTVFRETRRRWDDTQIYRRVEWVNPKRPFLDDYAEGPMSPSGKLHGEWKHVQWEPYREWHTWHWYGEEVSEGEWHLRTGHAGR